MRKKVSRTYKFGNLSVTIFPNEIIIIRLRKNKILTKTITLSPMTLLRRIVLSVVAVAVIAVITATLIPGTTDDDGNDGIDTVELDEDDQLKESLLLSEQTDYSVPEKETRLTITKHRVKPGENLSKIAQQYGVSIDTICGSNNLRSYDFIRSGVLLNIPNKDGILYTMKKGSRIVNVAKKYKVSLNKIIVENEIKNPDFIPANKTLFIPDAKPQNIVVGYMWPCRSRRITCGYGWRRNPFNRSRRQFHRGLDIGARYEWIRASKFGKVTYTGWMGGYGNAVIIAHPGGIKSLYAHLSRIIVRRGQYVKQGQTIAKSGNTGRSTGPHLHFEIIKHGKHKNPYYLLKRGR